MLREAELRKRLVAMGFRVVEPGAMSVEAQIAAFHEADVVLGSSGAGFANAIYCRPGTVVIEIQPQGMENQWVRCMCVINGLANATWFCPASVPDPKRPETGLSYELDVPAFLDFTRDVLARSGVSVEAPRRSLTRRVSDRLGDLFRP